MQTQQKTKLVIVLAVLALAMLLPARAEAQTEVVAPKAPPKQLDVYINEAKTVSVEGVLEEVVSSAPAVAKVEKLKNSDNQATITGLASGESMVTLRVGEETTVYRVNVSPGPERLYINIPESKRLTFTKPVDEVSVSVPGIVRVVQPDDKVVMLEAQRMGKTTVSVNCNGEVFRYFVSTFDNRGADLLEIQNTFAARGYRSLEVRFENDQATISGSIPTQEELDDAVRIVKQYTPYVIVKATVGTIGYDSSDTEEERVIANSILKIANVKGLIVKVKFPEPTEIRTNQYSRVVGAPTITNTTTDNQTRLTTTSTTLPTDTQVDGATNRLPAEGTVETINRTENYTRPEKIFLFGNLENDLDEAKAIRVARTFCPMVVNFCVVKNPIQVKLRTRIFQVALNRLKDTGLIWTDNSRTGPPSIRFGSRSFNSIDRDITSPTFGQLQFSPNPNPRIIIGSGQQVLDVFIKAISHFVEVDAEAQIRLLETKGVTKTLQDQSLTLINGQPGGYFNGSSIPYISGSTTSAGVVSFTTSFVQVGLRIGVFPLHYSQSKMTYGQIVLPGISGGAVSPIFTGPSAEKYLVNGPSSVVNVMADESVKYVDENGLITMHITTEVSALTQLVTVGPGIQAPQTTVRAAENRATVRNKQSLVAAGLFDQSISRAVRSVPFFNKIPIFGFLFENPVDNKSTTETLVMYTPEIILPGDPDSTRVPKPLLPELQREMTVNGIVPVMKPAKYMSAQVDLRDDKGKTAKKDKPKSAAVAEKAPAATLEVKPADDLKLPVAQPVSVSAAPVADPGPSVAAPSVATESQQKSSGRLEVPPINWDEPMPQGTMSVAVPMDSNPAPVPAPAPGAGVGSSGQGSQEAPVTP